MIEQRIVALRQLDAEPLPDARPETFEDDVRDLQHGGRRLGARVPRDDLLAGVQRVVDAGCRLTRRVALRRLDLHDVRAQPLELAARERSREVAGQIRHRDAGQGLHCALIMLRAAMSERTTDRRTELLDAAVRVFAAKGFHASRVGDIATEAGVAHGLLYHYFRSKEEVLETIFRETWTTLVRETVRIEASGAPFREQLRRFARIYLGSWLVTPELVCVLVREVARSPEVGRRVAEINELFQALGRIIEAGQQRGEVRLDVDPTVAAWALYGALEEILTGWVLGQLAGEEEDVERAVVTVVSVTHDGLAA